MSQRHDRGIGFGFPLVAPGGFVWPGTYFDPTHATYPDPYAPPAFGPPSYVEPETITGSIPGRLNPVVVYRRSPGCSTQNVTVPWDDGEEHSINIVRC